MTKLSLINALSLLSHAALSSAACSREVLQATGDAFLAKQNIKLSPTVKIAQNNIFVKSLAETVYGQFTGRAAPFQITMLDEAKCNIGMFTVLSAPTPFLTSIRAQILPSGEVTEVEILRNTAKGAKGAGAAVPATVTTPSVHWSAPIVGAGKAPTSHEALLKILDTYPSGIQGRSGKNVPATPDCARMENGQKMPFKCNQAFEGLGFPVTNRSFYADTKTGVGLSKFYFDQRAMPLWIHEYFKITDEKITEIQAVYLNYKGAFSDVFRSGKQ